MLNSHLLHRDPLNVEVTPENLTLDRINNQVIDWNPIHSYNYLTSARNLLRLRQSGQLNRQQNHRVNTESRLHGERWRDEGEFIPFPSSAVLLFSEAQTTNVHLDLACIFWPDPSLGFLKLALCVWANLKESWWYSKCHDKRVTHTVTADDEIKLISWEHGFSSFSHLTFLQ